MKTIKAKRIKVKKVKPPKKYYCKYCINFLVFVDKVAKDNYNYNYICDKETVRSRDFKGDMIVTYSELKPEVKNVDNNCIDYREFWFYKLFPFFKKG